MTKQDAIRAVDEALAARYGDRRWPGRSDPLGGLIATILSQSTTSRNSRAAHASLTEQYASWEQVAAAPVEDIATAIYQGGLAHQKAERIKTILRQLQAERGVLCLDFLEQMAPEEAAAYLTSFRGVGPKTAACVLLFDLGKPVFPVDTHVFRIAVRLGWIEEGTTPQRAHSALGLLVPADIAYRLHVNLVAHGRTTCLARHPRCAGCPLLKFCPWGLEAAEQSGASGQIAQRPA